MKVTSKLGGYGDIAGKLGKLDHSKGIGDSSGYDGRSRKAVTYLSAYSKGYLSLGTLTLRAR
jgi:hypothetical protein